jgi:uncharacterized protein
VLQLIVYNSTKENFLKDVSEKNIEDIVLSCVQDKLKINVGRNEINSWQNSLGEMFHILDDPKIPVDSGVAIEYRIPQTSKRIDFLLTGQDENNIEQVILIELKQWSKVQLTEKDAIVVTRFQHGLSEENHPSYQAWSYASLINSFNQTVYEEKIQLNPCAYLHNYKDDGIITNLFYADYIKKAPVFLKNDKNKLKEFIKKHVKYGDKKNTMFRIDEGKIKPSKSLADSLASMLKGNDNFVMIDDQKIVYETALELARKSSETNKNILIVEGGPGTGKSVVAINLLVALTKLGLVSKYVTKNSAPRDVYESMLTGHFRKSEISNMFSGSGAFTETEANAFDVLIIDEAHRLNEKSGMFKNKGINQVKEIIQSSKFSIFFIDEDQKVTWHDIGEKEEIIKWAKDHDTKVHSLELASQFRCNGSDGYVSWLDYMLGIRETANINLNKKDYDFKIVSSPNELRDIIFEKNKIKNKARLVAGYCWDWVSKKDSNKKDIIISEHEFDIKWNLANHGNLWILKPESVNEIGCIHTSQGLDLDYVGVIIGLDFIVRDGKVVTDPSKRAKTDSSLRGYKKQFKIDPVNAQKKADKIIKNTYRTLMTRGMKGCYVYFMDKETEIFFKSRIEESIEGVIDKEIEENKVIELFDYIKEQDRYNKYLPVYSLEAAAGGFGENMDVSEHGWVKIDNNKKLNKNMFVAKIVGHSMEPRILDGSYCIFCTNVVGSREGRIVVAQHHSISDVDSGGSFTIKKYHSEKKYNDDGSWEHGRIVLEPINKEYEPIIISKDYAEDFKIIAEFIDIV